MATVAPLIVITGATASGKSTLALALAERYGGEIICADSRTVYKGMDIGTAKPTREEQLRVPHHLLDVVEPGERFTAADFQRLAHDAIRDIRARRKVPFLVGGTGLYVDSVVLNYHFPETKVQNATQFAEQSPEDLSVEELQALLEKQHIKMPYNLKNKRHLISALKRGGGAGSALLVPDDDTHVVAITTDSLEIQRRITDRAQQIFSSGVLEEAAKLGRKYGWDSEAMTGNIYPILRTVIDGRLSEEEAIKLFIVRDRQLVKRQLTWLKRHDYVRWMTRDQASKYVATILG